MRLLPESLRGPAESHDADPLRYLRGVLAFFLGGGAVVALVLALTGLAPKALLLAGVLWILFGVLTGLVDAVLGPVAELAGGLLASVGGGGGGARTSAFSGEEALAAQGDHRAAAEAYRARAHLPAHRVTALLRRAELLAGPLGEPAGAAAELEALQRDADQLPPGDDIRLGLALAEVYEHRLRDPGRALAEVHRLLDRHPHLREARRLRGLLAELRDRHFAASAP